MTGEHARGQSPELTGGAGFVYEAHVAAYYLTALLAEASAPGLNHRIVRRVALQQKSAGEPLDDVIVDTTGADGQARLSLQVKRQLTISSAPTNPDFREVVLNSWHTLQKPGFREGVDRYGAATGTVSAQRLRELQRVCELARSSLDATSFFARGGEQGNAGQDFNEITGHFRTILADNGLDASNDDLLRLLKHFVVIQFDFLNEESTHASDAVEKLRAFVPSERQRAPDLWQQLAGIARDGAGRAAEYDRPALVARLSPHYHLLPAPSHRAELETLERFSAHGVASIVTDIAGTRIDRDQLREQVRQASEQHRFVQIRGLPGSGKSVLLHDLAAGHRTTGAALFLKSDRLQGNNWIDFAATLGLSVTDPRSLLADLAASGPPILFLDGIDRIGGPQRNIVIDLLNAMFADPDSPWKVVATLRDTGIEPLRNWLPQAAVGQGIGSVEIPAFNDAEAEALSSQQPALRPLLLGNPRIRAIARRPFFASVLARAASHADGSGAPAPQSEADLIREWWKRGGYAAEAVSVLRRKRALLEIAKKSASRSGLNVPLSMLTPDTVACLHELIDDGILQAVDDDRYRFAHDIYFEWSFYQALKDREDDWITGLTEVGEPPALGRVVELLAQSKFAAGDWATGLEALEASRLRTQWRRAWLIGPLTSADFEDHQDAFESVVSADGYRRLSQLLVWFQAERTTPNSLVLEGASLGLSTPERIQLADRLGWPSDPQAWRRLIDWTLDREERFPAALISNVVSILEVWQNATSMHANPVSQRIVDKALEWLIDIESRRHTKGLPRDLGRWKEGSNWETLDPLESSLRALLLNATLAYPAKVAQYLKHLGESEGCRRQAISDVLAYSAVLTRTIPDDLVGLFGSEVLTLLPEDQLLEWEREAEERLQEMERVRALPEAERNRFERFLSPVHIPSSLDDHHWRELSIDEPHGIYFPASPLREPFAALFEHSPSNGLALVRTVSNHATAAWRQLHRHSDERRGTPLPLELEFPWGRQTFWGDHMQYEWFRGRNGNYLLSSALMALERWAFDEISKERPVDEVVRDVVEGHENWGVLGIATALYLETQHVSPVSLALVGSQRLWKVDVIRQLHDMVDSSNLTGFGGLLGNKTSDFRHLEAVRTSNQRRCRAGSLRQLAFLHVFAEDEAIRTAASAAITRFPEHLPFTYEEEAQDTDHVADLRTTAEVWAELAKQENYRVSPVEGDESQILIELDNPRAQAPDVQASLARAAADMQPNSLWIWASRYFETGHPPEGFTIEGAVQTAQAIDHAELFNAQADPDLTLDVTKGAVCAVAAIVKCFVDEPGSALRAWASDVISRANRTPAANLDSWSSRTAAPWHPGIYIAHAAAGDIRHDRDVEAAKSMLFELCGHPLESVSMAAFASALSCWNEDDRFAWIVVELAVRLAGGTRHDHSIPQSERAANRTAEARQAVSDAQTSYEQGHAYPEISLPPAPWVETPEHDRDAPPRARSSPTAQRRSNRFWNADTAGSILKQIPIESIIGNPDRRAQYLRFMDGLLDWTIEYLDPPWARDANETRRRRADIGSWVADYAGMIARLAPHLPADETISRYLQRIFALDDELCAAFLNPLVSHLTAIVMDEDAMPEDLVVILRACTDRVLADHAFDPRRRRDSLYGLDLPNLVRNLFFIGIEQANGATRFANGEWKDIAAILPIVDKLIRTAGWIPEVMACFLKLCERAEGSYPTELFADQVLTVLQGQDLPTWRNTILPGRIAGLVQANADRDAPLDLPVSRKLLQVLDYLVDMGDRRSAALQISDAFRDIRLPARG
ncbi:ATP-binding protein [Luteimonas sp. BDR2-5]|uniref:NACHT domain-containing protein n=1 Tax=Proluteimonas luteida TaxID=2878685 RepID=UPI001E3706A3|nr:ATP-binding protein [Luteimonas sp. BDR2-5]MCD9026608.1 ATP-binding protein [Luteimonas sp. BDR2-5]